MGVDPIFDFDGPLLINVLPVTEAEAAQNGFDQFSAFDRRKFQCCPKCLTTLFRHSQVLHFHLT